MPLLSIMAQVRERTIGGESDTSWLMGLAVAGLLIAVFVLPFVLGWLLAAVLKVKDKWAHIGLVLFFASAALMPFVWPVVRYQVALAEYRSELDEWKALPNTSENVSDEAVQEFKAAVEKVNVIE